MVLRFSHAKAQRRKEEACTINFLCVFAPLRGKPPSLYACAALWQTLLNFSFVPVVIRSEQGFGRL